MGPDHLPRAFMRVPTRPDRSEAIDYFFTYIDQVPAGEICSILAQQRTDILPRLQRISDEQSLHRYGPKKWSIREVVHHMSDCERLFVFRAMWFARGFETPLPSFDQNVAVEAARANDRSWSDLIPEFDHVRLSTLDFFAGIPAEAWDRRGIASGGPFSVRALAYITAGHVEHHMRILRERYLPQLAYG